MKADFPREKEALEWVTYFFREMGPRFSSTDANWRTSKETLAKQAGDQQDKSIREPGGLALFQGDIRAIEMLCDLAARHLAEGKEMPEPLRIFTCLFLLQPFTKWRDDGEKLVPGGKIKSKPGPHPRDRSNRNHAICVAIETVMYRWGFDATRNPASKDSAKHVSAASIVRDGLGRGANINLTEAAVNKIWNDWGDRGGISYKDFIAANHGRIERWKPSGSSRP
jgi:hypothetical protein